MAIVIPSRPRLKKNDSLSTGLILDSPLNSKSGQFLPIDLVTGIRATSGGTGTKSQKVGKYGWSVDFNNTGQYFGWISHPLASSYSYLTAEVLILRESGGSGGNYGSMTGLRDTVNTTDWLSLQNDNGDSGWGTRINSFYTNREKVWSVAYPTNNLWHHYILRYDHTNKDNTPDVWQNLSKISLTNRFDNAWTKTINAITFYIGNNTTGTGSSWDGQIALVRWWKRMLSNQEVWKLLSDPTILYEQSNFYFFGNAPVVTPGSTYPGYYAHGWY